ncbi:Clavaminate synthase-like protein, partial [Backusella circina FSU 941]
TLEPVVPTEKQSGVDFGAIINDLDLENLSEQDFEKLYDAVFRYQVVVIRNQGHVTPETQCALTKKFDPQNIDLYGHGKMHRASESVISRDISPLPNTPQVQLLGHGVVKNHYGIEERKLTHPSHTVFHKTQLTQEEMDNDITRFYRWHMDAALYRYNPPKVTTLFGIKNPEPRRQTLRYDDGTGDTLDVQLGTTAFISGQKAFELLPQHLKELAFKTKVKYAPHPYLWMSKAKARPTGLGMESDGKELTEEELPEINEEYIKIYPMLWKNPVTNKIHLQVHPAAVQDLIIDGKPMGDLKKVRELLYEMQRPAINPENVFAHEWADGDMVIFHNRGVLHSVVGSLKDTDSRVFHQCNISSADEPLPVSEQDFAPYTVKAQ